MGGPERPRYQGRPFPWAAVFSDGRRAVDVTLVDPRDDAAVRADFRYVLHEERTESAWVKRSDETALRDRLVWVAGENDELDNAARDLARSQAMVSKYKPRRESLPQSRKLLLQQEENHVEDHQARLVQTVAAAWMSGKLYFRGRPILPRDHGAAFAGVLAAVGTRILPDLFPHFTAVQVLPAELAQLLASDLSGPSPKFLSEELGILELDSGRYVPACSGVVPRRVQEHIEAEGGLSGTALIAHFGGPPFGYTPNVVRACAAGLLRAGKVRIQPEGGSEITAVRDAGVQDLFGKDRAFRRANIFPGGEDSVGPQARARICKFFEKDLHHTMDREDHAIADAVAALFPLQAEKLRGVLERLLHQLPDGREAPSALAKLQTGLEACVRSCRQTKPTVALVKKHLDALRDGVQLLNIYHAELTDDAIARVRAASVVRDHQGAQLEVAGLLTGDLEAALERIREHLALERPWQDISALDADLELLTQAYTTARRELLEWQEQQVEQVRSRLKARPGFSTLSADQSHKVLRPFTSATTDTSADAIAPALQELKDPFVLRLQRAEAEANERLDEILSEGDKPLVRKVELGLRNRELATEADVDALLDEIRTKLMEQIHAGVRIRLT